MSEVPMLDALTRERAERLKEFFVHHFEGRPDLLPNHRKLLESMRYSLLQEGGKRFRPVLAMLTAEALCEPLDRALAFGAAVECVHTYSLIHDDLPAMDNDDFRRGKPTNHKVFGEANAILAGDALLTEAFQIVADSYVTEPQIAIRLVSELAQAAGFHGMVGGQAIDMGSKKDSISLIDLRTMHRLKTGALIRVSSRGAAIACHASETKLAEITVFAENLGLAFQVADDLLDFDPAKPEAGSYPALLGAEKTRVFLNELTDSCLASLSAWSEKAEPLRLIARYNCDRKL
jgi:geranylgeranyl diphosphate synthase type II